MARLRQEQELASHSLTLLKERMAGSEAAQVCRTHTHLAVKAVAGLVLIDIEQL